MLNEEKHLNSQLLLIFLRRKVASTEKFLISMVLLTAPLPHQHHSFRKGSNSEHWERAHDGDFCMQFVRKNKTIPSLLGAYGRQRPCSRRIAGGLAQLMRRCTMSLDSARSLSRSAVRRYGYGYICKEQTRLYSFFNADQIFDFLLSIGMRPFVELSFMPIGSFFRPSDRFFSYRANVSAPQARSGAMGGAH